MDTLRGVGSSVSEGSTGQILQMLTQLGGLGITAAGGTLGPVLLGTSGILENTRERAAQRRLASQLPEGTPYRRTADILANRLALTPAEYERIRGQYLGSAAINLLPQALAPVTETVPQPPLELPASEIEMGGRPTERVSIPMQARREERAPLLPESFARVPVLSRDDEIRTLLMQHVARAGLATESPERLARATYDLAIAGGASPDQAEAQARLVRAGGRAAIPTGGSAETRRQAEEFTSNVRARKYGDLSDPKDLQAAYNDATRIGPGAVQAFRDYANMTPVQMGQFVREQAQQERYRTVEVPNARRRVQQMTQAGYAPEATGALGRLIDNFEFNPTAENKRAVDRGFAAAETVNQRIKRAQEMDRLRETHQNRIAGLRERNAKLAARRGAINSYLAEARAAEQRAKGIERRQLMATDEVEREQLRLERVSTLEEARQWMDWAQEEGRLLEADEAAEGPSPTTAPSREPRGREYRQTPSGALVPVPSGPQ